MPGLELLRIQAEGSLDERGRIAGCYGVTLASCADGHALWIGAGVPDTVAGELMAALDRASPVAPGEPPPVLDRLHELLEDGGPLERTAGPSYVIPPETHFASEVEIVRPGGAGADRLRSANPGNWHPVEWDELLDGRLGPWAIAMHGAQAISICHTPGPVRERAAECGVWTDPRFRGHGYAAATAVAWIPLVRAPQRQLFYSTDADNRSSQRVAQRLGLREIGWTWRLRRPRAEAAAHLHPLCSLYRA